MIKPVGRLFWKFFLAFQAAQLLLALGIGGLVWLYAQSHHEQQMINPQQQAIQNLAAALLREGGEAVLREQLPTLQGREELLVVNAQGQELLGRPLPPVLQAALGQSSPPSGGIQPVSTPAGRYWMYMPMQAQFNPPSLGGMGLPNPEAPPPPRENDTQPPPPPFPWIHLVTGLLVSLGFSALMAWFVVKPIRQLQQAFRQLASGQLDIRIGPSLARRRDEFSQLGADFDSMARQLEAMILAQRRLFHDVSHELRSPLARLQAAIGLAQQDPARMQQTLERVERESGRMEELVDELLTLARLDSGLNGGQPEQVDVAALLKSIVEDAGFEAGSQVRLEYAGPDKALAPGRAELICRSLENVIRNGLKYSPPQGLLRVRLEQSAKALHVAICDQGPGIAPEEMARIFEPFFRGQSPNSPGYGLGLAIARRAVESHGGCIYGENLPEGGLCMHIELPLETG